MNHPVDALARRFSKEFIWGAATSSYQIEGAWDKDGKGESIWDRFSHTPGNIEDGSTGDTACDHYHRWGEDISLMKELGLGAYRFSISWPRVLPEGTCKINEAGISFYSRLIDRLLEANIQPFVTLYHWDLPQALQEAGGWPARSCAEAFLEYAGLVSRRLGDRVVYWSTFNEPFVSAYLGYLEGVHAPGHQDLDEMLAASHHLLLAHGGAVPLIRSNSPGSRVGLILNLIPQYPASLSDADQAAARLQDGIINRWYLDPIAGRGYPDDVARHYDRPMDFVLPGDLEQISRPMDFLGINYYTRGIARSTAIPEEENLPRSTFASPEQTEMGWEVYPHGLYDMLRRVYLDYGFSALFITENGAAFPDSVGEDGQIHDFQRIRYLHEHFSAAAAAVETDVPLRGYFVWSLLDNFEWSFGYTKAFGMIEVDHKTRRRILKDSARWYQAFLVANQ